MFENKLTHNGIHYTRYIMSWIRSGGYPYFNRYKSDFASWLRETQELTEEEIDEICEIGSNGKMELETSAALYINANNCHQYDKKYI